MSETLNFNASVSLPSVEEMMRQQKETERINVERVGYAHEVKKTLTTPSTQPAERGPLAHIPFQLRYLYGVSSTGRVYRKKNQERKSGKRKKGKRTRSARIGKMIVNKAPRVRKH